jgi:hypothetical protein
MLSKFGRIIAAVTLLLPTSAWSQTAEETVAFMMYGHELGKLWQKGDAVKTLNVVKNDNCHYEVKAEIRG